MHTTVLLHEAIDALVTATDGIYVDGTFGRGGHTRELLGRLGPGARAGGIYVDGTFGRGGHSRLILSRLNPDARLIAFDKDPQAIEAGTPDVLADFSF